MVLNRRIGKINTQLEEANTNNKNTQKQLTEVENQLQLIKKEREGLKLAKQEYNNLEVELQSHRDLHNEFMITLLRITNFNEGYSSLIVNTSKLDEGLKLEESGLELISDIEKLMPKLKNSVESELIESNINLELTCKISLIYSCIGIIEYYAKQYKDALNYLELSKQLNKREHTDRYHNIIAVCGKLYSDKGPEGNRYLDTAYSNLLEIKRRSNSNDLEKLSEDEDVKLIWDKLMEMENQPK